VNTPALFDLLTNALGSTPHQRPKILQTRILRASFPHIAFNVNSLAVQPFDHVLPRFFFSVKSSSYQNVNRSVTSIPRSTVSQSHDLDGVWF